LQKIRRPETLYRAEEFYPENNLTIVSTHICPGLNWKFSFRLMGVQTTEGNNCREMKLHVLFEGITADAFK
jgi:hypothetical protein